MQEKDASLMLLTYKGKVLLTIENGSPIRSKSDLWCFIEAKKKDGDTFDKAICKRVEEMLGLLIKDPELLSHWTFGAKKKYFYHYKLSDEDVNAIKRPDGETIDFFSVRELEKLPMSHLTKLLIEKHKDVLEKTSHPTLQSMQVS